MLSFNAIRDCSHINFSRSQGIIHFPYRPVLPHIECINVLYCLPLLIEIRPGIQNELECTVLFLHLSSGVHCACAIHNDTLNSVVCLKMLEKSIVFYLKTCYFQMWFLYNVTCAFLLQKQLRELKEILNRRSFRTLCCDVFGLLKNYFLRNNNNKDCNQ